MDKGQTTNYVNATLAFLNRTQLTGQESETLVEIKRWLVGLTQPAKAVITPPPPLPPAVEADVDADDAG